jgi:hypothetical protein
MIINIILWFISDDDQRRDSTMEQVPPNNGRLFTSNRLYG